MTEKISVIVPVFNAEATLDRCLQSIVSQTYKNLEIILINDGSEDKSLDICRAWEKQDNRIVLFNQKNNGVSSARNLGIDKATGDYVAFVDSDDWIAPNMYEKLIKKAKESQSDLTFCYFKIISEENKKINVDFGLKDFIRLKNYSLFFLTPDKNVSGMIWRILFKKESIKGQYFNIEIKLAEDLEFLIRIVGESTLALVEEPLYYHYLLKKETLFQKYNYKPWYMESQQKLGNAVFNDLVKIGEYELAKGQLFGIYYNMVSLYCEDKTEKVREIKKLIKSSYLYAFNSDDNYKSYKKCFSGELNLKQKVGCYLMHKKFFSVVRFYRNYIK